MIYNWDVTFLASSIFFREEFALEEGCALAQPVLVLHVNDAQFLKADVVRGEPCVQQTLAHKAKDPAVIDRVARHVQLPLKLKQNVEQPGAVVLQKFLLHDEHVEVVAVGLRHIQVIRGQVLGTFARNDGAGPWNGLYMHFQQPNFFKLFGAVLCMVA